VGKAGEIFARYENALLFGFVLFATVMNGRACQETKEHDLKLTKAYREQKIRIDALERTLLMHTQGVDGKHGK
jgi:hypothetical protein